MDDTQKLRTVLLAAPCYDGKVGVWHAVALAETCKIGLANGINVMPLYMSFDALVQRARNDIFHEAYVGEVDDLVFIDADQDWNPHDFMKLLLHDAAVVGAPVPKKSDVETYNVKLLGDYVVGDNGLAKVDGIGTGFLRVRKDAIKAIYEAAPEYKEPHKSAPSRVVFDVCIRNGELWSEDVVFCQHWIDLGGSVFIDPTINCGHSGEKRWVGGFADWIMRIKQNGN